MGTAGESLGLPTTKFYVSDAVPDLWAVSTSNGAKSDFVRLSGGYVVEFFSRSTPQALASGGFDLRTLPGVNSPERLFYAPRPSPDGAYVIAYWLANYLDDSPKLTVFDRNGKIVSQVPNTAYNTKDVTAAVDWLPDGRFVFLAGNNLVIGAPTQTRLDVIPLNWPTTVTSLGAGLWASPDGKHVLLSLLTAVKTAQGSEVNDGLLYLVDIDGKNFRQLTTVSANISDTGFRVYHDRATWSSDGQQILFAVDSRTAVTSNWIPAWSKGCPVVMRVSASANKQVIDGWNDPDTSFYSGVNGGPNSPKGKVNACGDSDLAWVEP